MVENVRKAIKIDEHVPDSLITSMVDDVFYVLKSSFRRATLTSSMNTVLSILSDAMNLLSNEYQEALQHKMREPNLGTGTEIATTLDNMDVSSEYVLKIRHGIEEQCVEIFPALADREKIKSCFSELGERSTGFKQALNAGIEQLISTVTPRIRHVLNIVGTISYEISEAEYVENEANGDSFVHLIIDFIVKRLEVIMMQKKFIQLGGLQLDRDARSLVSHFSGMTQRTVRDKFARLTQISTILNLEKVYEILDFWGRMQDP
ncbi:hypothetical protein MKX01_030400 [Papaver californicum]|nr:hypothetical protein MKX01_030400 [Papaver californicum]